MATENEQNMLDRRWVPLMAIAALLAAAPAGHRPLAPHRTTMGDAQRIVYLHVPLAWLGLLGLLADGRPAA